MIELSVEQHDAMEEAGDEPIRVIDPATRREYVILASEEYDRVKSNSDERWADRAYLAALPVFARDGWDDPRMDVYDTMDPRRD